jgi:hypothetical protein
MFFQYTIENLEMLAFQNTISAGHTARAWRPRLSQNAHPGTLMLVCSNN